MLSRIFAVTAFGLLSMAAGCAPGPRSVHEAEAAPLDTRSIRDAVARVRGLPERAPTPITVLDDGAFVRLLDQRRGGADVERDTDTGGLGGAAQLVAEQVRAVELADTIGFYDERQRAIYLRRRPPRDEGLPLSWILAHELTHSLQHQHFRLLDPASLPTVDAQLAYLALLEGDAMVTMVAYGSGENFVPTGRALTSIIRDIRKGESKRFEEVSRPESELEAASPLIREQFVFPYLSGTVFVAELYRAGGFDLVNRVYRYPPATTEQVLHPEKYIQGEGPIAVTAPTPPSGYTTGATGRTGELGARGLLQHCVPKDVAVTAAAGWGGDAFTVAVHPNGAELILWSTAWDSTRDAVEFAAAVSRCYEAGTEAYVARFDKRVSVIAGFPISNANEIHRYLAGLPARSASARPPLGPVTLTPIPELPETSPTLLSEGRYVNPRLDITVPIPKGLRASLEEGWLSAERSSDDLGLLSVGFSNGVVSTESLAKIYRDFVEDIRPHLKGRHLSVSSNARTTTPLGPALERTWIVKGTPVQFQVIVVPICDRQGSILYTRLWADDYTERLLRWVINATRRLRGGVAPVCAELLP